MLNGFNPAYQNNISPYRQEQKVSFQRNLINKNLMEIINRELNKNKGKYTVNIPGTNNFVRIKQTLNNSVRFVLEIPIIEDQHRYIDKLLKEAYTATAKRAKFVTGYKIISTKHNEIRDGFGQIYNNSRKISKGQAGKIITDNLRIAYKKQLEEMTNKAKAKKGVIKRWFEKLIKPEVKTRN